MGNLEGSVNDMVRYSIYKLSGNSPRNMFANEFDCPQFIKQSFNLLNPELNPICYLLALLELNIFSTLAG